MDAAGRLAWICPRCGEQMPTSALECPSCHLVAPGGMAAKMPRKWHICEACLTIAQPKKRRNMAGRAAWVAFILAPVGYLLAFPAYTAGQLVVPTWIMIAFAEHMVGFRRICGACGSPRLVRARSLRGYQLLATIHGDRASVQAVEASARVYDRGR